jgi:hypothetical protein
LGNAIFEDMGSRAGPAFSQDYLARGLAIGDWDNDGAPDAIFTCIGERPVLLRNMGQRNAWVGLHLTGVKSNRDAIGAKATLRAADRKLVRRLTGGSSYLASHDKRVLFGLGKLSGDRRVDVEIVWPNGNVQIATSLEINRYHRIVEQVSK